MATTKEITNDEAVDTQSNPEEAHVDLDEPLTRGGKDITSITVRRPKSGALRGVSLMDLVNLNVSALTTVLPRITTPTLTKQDVENLCPADLTSLGVEVAGFLATKKQRQGFQ